MYSRRPCIVLTELFKEKNENLKKLKTDVVETLSETGMPKEEITNNIDKLHRIRKIDKNNTQNTIIKFKTHSFKEKFTLKEEQLHKEMSKSNYH